ncbi:MAG: TldD/PmbA family protein [Acidobacteria bacterium]|nr:TldD/PmbA family protein [Acidobacteriota bacterium]
MIDESKARAWFDWALHEARKHSVGDVEMSLHASESALTRFANNTIHQNVSDESGAASIRVAIGKRTARVSTNRLDEASLRRATSQAIDLARANEEDPGLPPMAPPEAIAPVDRWDAETATLSAEARAGAVREAIGAIAGSAAGIYSSERSTQFLLNSNGVFARHDETGATFSVTATASDSSGWAKASAVPVGDIDTLALARSASEKAARSKTPRRMDPGVYRVILEPAAVLDLVGQIFGDCSATALDEERSFLNGRFNERIFGSNITIRDDVRHPLQDGAPFDGEGVARRALTLFESGYPREMPYSRPAALRAGRPATGHGYALPNDVGESPVNVVIEGGSSTMPELMAKLGRGILVTRLWYIREVDPIRKVMTGMTRDGTFFVDGGEIQRGVRNFRFNVSVVDLLNAVEAMTAPGRASGEESFDMVVPAMLVAEFPFTEVTMF